MTELSALHSGWTVEQWTADADRDHWLTAPEAAAYGASTASSPPRPTSPPSDGSASAGSVRGRRAPRIPPRGPPASGVQTGRAPSRAASCPA
ncbi:ATP-dependent Clp protease proteolytic subunit [Kitasatospora sp. NPDC054939]